MNKIFINMSKQLLNAYIQKIIKETISLPPRNLNKFYGKIIPSKIIKFKKDRDMIIQTFSKMNEDLVWDFFGDTFENRSLEWNDLKYTFRESDRLKHFEDSLDVFMQLKERWALSHIVGFGESLLEDIEKYLNVATTILNNKQNIVKTAEQYKTDSIKFYDEKFPENIPQMLFNLANSSFMLKKTLVNVVNKTNEFLRHKREGEKPPHEEVETLYHASVNAKKIYEEGFKTDIPDIGGLGGSQTLEKLNEKGVSFTADLYVAKEIARSLKEVIGIANKKYDFRDVIHWALQDGVSENDLTKEYELKKRASERPKLNSIKETFELYRRYLTFAESKGTRYNPMYFGVSVESFKGLKEENIGVIEAKVDMTNPNIIYFRGMHEFRVPVASIIELTKLIR